MYAVYIVGSLSGTLYIGVTNDLARRVWEHKNGMADGFTKRYGVHRLLHYENFYEIGNAIEREKQLKGWRRAKKIALVEKMNPHWEDLSREWYGRGPSTRRAQTQVAPRSG